MPLETIYVVRHGFRSSWSVDPKTGVYTGIPSPTGIHGDPALTSYGVDQSRELARYLMTVEPAVEKVYSSPFYRCLQTMTPFMDLQRARLQHDTSRGGDDQLHLQQQPTAVTTMQPEHGIREWFGSAPFDHPEPAAPGVLKSMFPSYDDSYRSVVTPSKRGETLEQLQERITTALRDIIERSDAEGTRSIVLCSHAAVIILIGRILTGQVPSSVDVDDFQAYTCGLSVYTRGKTHAASATIGRDDRHSSMPMPCKPDLMKANLIGGWDCEMNSDCSFLSGGAERGWKFSGDESFPDTGSLSQTNAESKL